MQCDRLRGALYVGQGDTPLRKRAEDPSHIYMTFKRALCVWEPQGGAWLAVQKRRGDWIRSVSCEGPNSALEQRGDWKAEAPLPYW